MSPVVMTMAGTLRAARTKMGERENVNLREEWVASGTRWRKADEEAEESQEWGGEEI